MWFAHELSGTVTRVPDRGQGEPTSTLGTGRDRGADVGMLPRAGVLTGGLASASR